MITELDLDAAIAECQGVKNPNAKTCMMLAAFLTIKREMFGFPEQLDNSYSYTPSSVPPESSSVTYTGETEFAKIIRGKDADTMWEIVDELMSLLQALNPRLYKNILQKVKEG